MLQTAEACNSRCSRWQMLHFPRLHRIGLQGPNFPQAPSNFIINDVVVGLFLKEVCVGGVRHATGR